MTPSGPLTSLLDRYPSVRVQLVGALYRVSVTVKHAEYRQLSFALAELEEKTR